ncbi:hypothetical protein [Actinomadura bangladeshensis]|uniref:Uncharacterized protein n=1 Tax=Actinomadura bangladeshensis TaxID=453573 RepID=A0A4R4NSL2_9ACTN|nr:hypothetical protein [Actinomadura bangladeshensis]TDC12395.1 hypothetical protein E1284_23635 [Actinomadura bangladeshensis]
MVRVLGAWGAALLVWLVGFAIVARLASRADGGSFAAPDRIFRLDLPWIAISVLMVAAAAAVQRDRTSRPRWLAALLAVPLLATAAGAAAPLGDGGVLPTALYVLEGAAGAAMGLILVVLIRVKAQGTGGYW